MFRGRLSQSLIVQGQIVQGLIREAGFCKVGSYLYLYIFVPMNGSTKQNPRQHDVLMEIQPNSYNKYLS
jgi:hypothetical protein